MSGADLPAYAVHGDADRIRYPHVGVDCSHGGESNDKKAFDDPRIISEISSAGNARTGPSGWTDVAYQEPTDLMLPSVAATLMHAEIFARD